MQVACERLGIFYLACEGGKGQLDFYYLLFVMLSFLYLFFNRWNKRITKDGDPIFITFSVSNSN